MASFIEKATNLFWDIGYLILVFRSVAILKKDQVLLDKELQYFKGHRPTANQAEIIDRIDPVSNQYIAELAQLESTHDLNLLADTDHPTQSITVLCNRAEKLYQLSEASVKQSKQEAIQAVRQSIKALLGLNK